MNLLKVMTNLYASEISCGIQSDWDGGVRVWLGHGASDGHREHWFAIGEYDAMADWLDGQARRHYPESEYAAAAPDLVAAE